jgi:hypothetical protein
MEAKASNKLVLPTLTAVCLWHSEVSGQISDGTWENSVPHDHYKFWCHVKTEVGDKSGVVLGHNNWSHPKRTTYNIVNLANVKWDKEDGREGDDRYILRSRMLQHCRLALAQQKLGRPLDTQTCRHAKYMPEKLYQFQACKASGIWEHDFVGKYLENVDEELAQAYYAAEYSVDQLKADLKSIQDAMRVPAIREEKPADTNVAQAV